MFSINKIINIGVDKVEEDFLRKKIIVSNVVALIMIFGVAVPFIIVAAIFYPALVYLVVIAIVVVSFAFLMLNRMGYNVLGRSLIGLSPVAIAVLFCAQLLDFSKPIDIHVFLLCFSLMPVPSLLFDFRRETKWFIIINLLGVILVSNFESLSVLMDIGLDDSFARDGWLKYVFYIFAVAVIFSNIIVLNIFNGRSEDVAKKYYFDSKEKEDELKASQQFLVSKLQELEDSKLKESRDNWVATGLANTGDILRENRANLDGLSESLVQFLAKYVKASSATLFIREKRDGEDVMELKATYAYDRDNIENRFITKEDGLVGQCWKEGEYNLIKNVPSNYVKINSGLGQAEPKNILIIPFKDNTEQKTEAILELSAFQEIRDLDIELLQKLGGGVASAIKTNKTEELTADLLKDAQQMSQELREQEEELRQNAEEMMATQEELEKQLIDSTAEVKALKEKYGEA